MALVLEYGLHLPAIREETLAGDLTFFNSSSRIKYFLPSMLEMVALSSFLLKYILYCPAPKPQSPATSSSSQQPGVSRMRQRFNELVDDAFSLFGSPAASPKSGATFVVTSDKAGGEGNPCLSSNRWSWL